MLNDLRQRADDSKILIEGWDNFTATLPTLSGLLEAIGGPQLEELTAEVGSLAKWRIESVQHYVGSGDGPDKGTSTEPDGNDDEDPEEWVQLYENSNFPEAENAVSRTLSSDPDRRKSARLYNDRGYIRYRMEKKEEAKRDLQRALDLHNYHLPLTLSNLGVAYLDSGDYESAMSHIRDAIFLTLSAEDVSAGYLRLRLQTGYRATQGQWEQHPANVLEASYINLSFALVQSGTSHEAIDVLKEGLDLMPSSIRLKHALARLHLSQQRVDLAEPIYRDIADQRISDPLLANEVNAILRSAPRRRSGRRRNR